MPWIQEQVKKVVDREKANGKDIEYAQFDYVEDGYVTNGHPTVLTHWFIAAKIIRAIKEAGWLRKGL